MNFFRVSSEQPLVQPDILFQVGNFPITNAMLMGVFVTALVTVFALVIRFRSKLIPGKFQNFIELLFEAFIGLLEQISGSREKAEKLLPLIGTIFIFFGISNTVGLIPGLTSITYNGISLFRTPTNDFNMTFSVACGIILLTHIMSIRVFGFFGHLGKFFKFHGVYSGFKKGIRDGMLSIIDFLIGLLDIVSELAKVVSLSLRLFGNMFAGEILAAVILGAFPLFLPAPWMAMNILVGFLQAMVFGSLTAAYYTMAVEPAE